MDFCKYVNVFQGTGEIDLPKPQGIAAKWFFIKAGCGNTSPAACVSFGAMSVSPYSGGYPTGYGNHLPNSHSRPARFAEGEGLLGFAHLQQSGVGAIGYYYNYAVVTPKYDGSPERRAPQNELAKPGYYSCTLEDINCEITATERVALHRYTFGKSGGRAVVEFDNNGLNIPGIDRAKADVRYVKMLDGNTCAAKAEIEGVMLWFAVRGNGRVTAQGTRAVFEPSGNSLQLKVSISLTGVENAVKYINDAPNFDEAEAQAYKKWNSELSKIKIETDDEQIKEIFYSNFYHSLVKPSDWSGESFIYDGDRAFVTDFATLWDMYKTGLPLLMMIDREIGEKIVETLLSLGESLGFLPNSLGISDEYKLPTEQARMLGAYVLITAYRYGVKMDVHRMLRVIEKDVFAPNKTDFTVDGRCKSYTWMLDMADGCALACEVAKEVGETEIYERLYPLSKQWESCFSEKTGLLKEDSAYYEGTLYNYSFRQMVDMERRIEIAGGRESFVKLLDSFFGYGAEDTVQPTDPFDYAPVAAGIKLGRFEGFNNESDTEAPFSYIYAGRQDRTCEIIRCGMKYMFTTGRGGLPGNNDTGALSSYFVFAALGIFPVAGQNLFLIGSPTVDGAEISLANSAALKIEVVNNSDKNIYVKSVKFNGNELEDFRISADELLKGGTLKFEMSDKTKNI